MKNIKTLLSNVNGKKVLDVCTGVGQFVDVLKSSLGNYESIIGIDNLEKVVEMAREGNTDPKVSFQIMSCDDLSFKNDLFNLVAISNSLHHLENPADTLSEIKRVTAPKGYILISEMYQDNQDHKQMSHVKFHHWSADIGRRMGKVHNDTYSREELKNILLSNDLEIIEECDHVFHYEETKDSIDSLLSTVDKILKDTHDVICGEEDFDALVKEGAELKEYIEKNGFEHATTYMALCRKKM